MLAVKTKSVTSNPSNPAAILPKQLSAISRSFCCGRTIAYFVGISSFIFFLVLPYVFAGFIIVPPAYSYHHPHHPPLTSEAELYLHKIVDPKVDFGYEFEEVSFPVGEGAILRGWLVPGEHRDKIVITVHGATEDRRQFLRQLPVFHELGMSVLMFDCREHGLSDGDGRGVTYSVREHEDVLAATQYAHDQLHAKSIVLVGTSQGAASSLLAAARSMHVDAVIAENPFSSPGDLLAEVVPAAIKSRPRWGAHEAGLGRLMTDMAGLVFPDWYVTWVVRVTLWRLGATEAHNVEQAMRKIAPRPVLLMHSTNDTMIAHSHSERLYQAAAHRATELWLPTGAAHALLYNEYPKEWTMRVQAFLRRYVL